MILFCLTSSIMPLGFDHCAVRFATVVIVDRLTRRGIGEAESEPRGQRRLPLRIDDAADILLILNIESLYARLCFPGLESDKVSAPRAGVCVCGRQC